MCVLYIKECFCLDGNGWLRWAASSLPLKSSVMFSVHSFSHNTKPVNNLTRVSGVFHARSTYIASCHGVLYNAIPMWEYIYNIQRIHIPSVYIYILYAHRDRNRSVHAVNHPDWVFMSVVYKWSSFHFSRVELNASQWWSRCEHNW